MLSNQHLCSCVPDCFLWLLCCCLYGCCVAFSDYFVVVSQTKVLLSHRLLWSSLPDCSVAFSPTDVLLSLRLMCGCPSELYLGLNFLPIYGCFPYCCLAVSMTVLWLSLFLFASVSLSAVCLYFGLLCGFLYSCLVTVSLKAVLLLFNQLSCCLSICCAAVSLAAMRHFQRLLCAHFSDWCETIFMTVLLMYP